jgi:phosphopantothenoylcysteine decarboxylase/phosphopantothenate--cysteine ligase
MGMVLVGVTGCIAAYKACEIVRLLQKSGHDVKVVMTEHAAAFVGPTTFRALTGHEVAVGLFDDPADPIHHISLAKEADVFLIAPATANVVAKISKGVADDLLTTTALATQAPLVIAPAMNSAMWSDDATQENIAALEARGATIVVPGSGYLACGDEGQGRLEDPEAIVDAALEALARKRDLEGKRVLITAGPTQEPLDPVRYISNGSSGKSGFALAAEAVARGALVTLVSGPVSLRDPEGVDVVHVRTAREMLAACEEPFAEADIAIFVAAVSDWRPANPQAQKIKHDGGNMVLDLEPNPDIAATLAEHKRATTVVVYAAETGDPVAAAKHKLEIKHADMVVANDVSGELGMGSNDNRVWLVTGNAVDELPVMSKRQIARALFDRLL